MDKASLNSVIYLYFVENLKNKLEYLDEVAKLEYDEWADNKEEKTYEYRKRGACFRIRDF